MKELQENYDVIIIGAGISGLTSSALLSKAGLSVCVLDKAQHVGGYLQGFTRKGFRFDSALHWLNQCSEEFGIVSTIFKFLGNDYPKVKHLKNIHRYKSETYDYLLTSNPDELKDAFIKDFPHEKKGIEKFFKVSKKMGIASRDSSKIIRTPDTMSFFEKVKNTISKIMFIKHFIRYVWYPNEKVPKGLDLFFKDKELQKVFSSNSDLLSCMLPIGWAYINDYQIPPDGGSQVFPEWLSYYTRFFDNEVYTNSTVTKIIVENNIAKGVVFVRNKKEHTIKSKYIIAACDVDLLYKKLLPKNTVNQEFLAKLDNAILYESAVQLSIALDCKTEDLGFKEELIQLSVDGISRKDHSSSDPNKCAISILPPSLRDKTLAPKGKGTLTLLVLADISHNNYWQTKKDENGNYIRTEEYYKYKEEYADILIERVVKSICPTLREHIKFVDIATPITHFRYTGNRKGSIMGARPGKENMQAKIAHHKTNVKNLFLSGHWSELGGGVPIAVKSAANSSLLVLQEENNEAFKILANYMDGKITLQEVKANKVYRKYDNSWIQKPTPAQRKQRREN